MRNVAMFAALLIVLSSCSKFDFNKDKHELSAQAPRVTYGQILFELDTLLVAPMSIDSRSTSVVIDITAIGYWPDSAGSYQLRLFADNNLEDNSLKSFELRGYIVNDTLVGDIIYKDGYRMLKTGGAKIPLSVKNLIDVPENQRLLSSANDVKLQTGGGATLRNFQIDAQSFGGNTLVEMTRNDQGIIEVFNFGSVVFNLNGQPAGSRNGNTPSVIETRVGSSTPGCCESGSHYFDSVTFEFPNNAINSNIKTLTFKFIDDGGIETYNNRIGEFRNLDGNLVSARYIEATDAQDKVYKSKQDWGYTAFATGLGWLRFYNGTPVTPGFLSWDFECTLFADDGSTMELRNGHVSVKTSN